MPEVIRRSECGTMKVYACPDCGDEFTAEDADPEGTNRSPCCGKMSSLMGEGLYVDGADVVILDD